MNFRGKLTWGRGRDRPAVGGHYHNWGHQDDERVGFHLDDRRRVIGASPMLLRSGSLLCRKAPWVVFQQLVLRGAA